MKVEGRNGSGARFAALVMMAAAAGLFVTGCGESGSSADPMALAPPNAFGIIHVVTKPVADSVLAELRKQGADLGDAPVDEIQKTAAKAGVMDVFLVPAQSMIPVDAVAIVRSAISPADFAELMKTAGDKPKELKNLGNGRYCPAKKEDGPVMIYGAEASDVPAGVLLFGNRTLLTDEFIKTLGTGKNEKLRAVVKGVRASAPVWLAASLESLPLPLPVKVKSVSGWFDVAGGGDGRVSITFGDEDGAKKVHGQLSGSLDEDVAEFVAMELKGSVVTIAPKGGDLIARLASEMIESQRRAKEVRRMSELKQVGVGIHMYGTEHDDAAPPDIAALDKYLSKPTLARFTSGKFVYRKPAGKLDSLAADAVLAHEALDGATGEVAVLFADGSVKAMSVADLRKLLK